MKRPFYMPHAQHPDIYRHVRQSQLGRLRWIETALRNSETLAGPDYCGFFRVSQPTFTHDMNKFVGLVEIFGGEARRIQGWLAVDLWPEMGVCGDIGPIDWQKIRAPGSVVEVAGPQVAIEDEDVRLALSRAIMAKVRVHACYISTTSGARDIRISPHAIVLASGRHHVRAFDHDKNGFRDFVLARMSNVGVADGLPYVDAGQDGEWHRFVEIRFSVRDHFPPDRRKAIALGFGLSDAEGEIVMKCRQCLVDYQLLAMGLRPATFVDYLTYDLRDPSHSDPKIS